MAGYCDITDVEALNSVRGAYTSTGTPTITQVQKFIDQCYAEINNILASVGVTVPVSPANDFLKMTNALGAAGLAEASGSIDVTNPSGSKDPYTFRWSEYKERLNRLLKMPDVSGGVMVGATRNQYARSNDISKHQKQDADFTRRGNDW